MHPTGHMTSTAKLQNVGCVLRTITRSNYIVRTEYNISMADDVVMFTRKEPLRENNAPSKLPKGNGNN